MERGEIYYITKTDTTGSEQIAGRPGIIVSNNANNSSSETVEVVFLTTQEKKSLPTHVAIKTSGRDSTALCEQISTISVTRVSTYVGTCTKEEMAKLDEAMAISIGIKASPQDLIDQQMELASVKAERDLYSKLYNKLLTKLLES